MNRAMVRLITVLFIFVLSACSPAQNPVPTTNAPAEVESPQGTLSETVEAEAETSNEASQPISFLDPKFAQLIKQNLGKEDIYPEDLQAITRLSIAGDHFMLATRQDETEQSVGLFFGTEVELDGVRYAGFGTMKSLADLEYFPNLTSLRVTLHPVIDYASIPQAILAQLRVIAVTQSQLKDIAFLQGAASVFSLNLAFNEIEDLSSLSECKELLYLDGDWNKISDLSPLAGLSQLKSLTFYGNQISDLSPLAKLTSLESLGLYHNQVSDLSPLTGLSSLKELEMINNQIKDVSPLKDFQSFDSIRLNGNPIENIELLSHIENLEYDE